MIQKVFVVYDVDDPYCGYWIQKIFSNEEAAKEYVEYYNSTNELAKQYDMCKIDYFEVEVFDNFVLPGKIIKTKENL